jgi:hypothetical protein
MADIGSLVGQRYGAVLLHRPAGVLPAADFDPAFRAAGEDAARQAVAAGTCAADLSSLYLLGLLSDDDRLRIRSALPGTAVIVSRSAVSDALLTRDHVRNLSAATYTASLAPDGTIDRNTLSAEDKELMVTWGRSPRDRRLLRAGTPAGHDSRRRGRRDHRRPGQPAPPLVRRQRPAAEGPPGRRHRVQPARPDHRPARPRGRL